MRIIAGRLGGRQFDSPSGHRTHPMSDKIRGALFNVLGDIEGLTVLDAFAGTGACGFEAISRGASYVVAIDVDKNAVQTIRDNAANLKIDSQMKIIQANTISWSENNPEAVFDIVILDPPYDDVKTSQLSTLVEHTKTGGLIIISLPPTVMLSLANEEYDLISQKSYGDATLSFCRKTG